MDNSNDPKRNIEEIKQCLVACGFDPYITVNIWEEGEDEWRWTGKTGLAIAICSYEWSQANLGKRFSNSIYEVKGEYIFPTGININKQDNQVALSRSQCAFSALSPATWLSVLVANKPITKPCSYYKPILQENQDSTLRSLESQ